jgi:uncharacterized protein DUF4157
MIAKLQSTPKSSFFPPVFGSLLQRKCACGNHSAEGECDECKKEKDSLQRKSAGGAEFVVPAAARDVLASPGQPLDGGTRDRMERQFSHDFSSVRVHHDARAAASAEAVHASAYTVGTHVVFGAGNYAPSTPSGQALIAHELAHTIQQQIGQGSDYRTAEREADRAEQSIHTGAAVQVSSTGAREPLQRQPADEDKERGEIVKVTKRAGDPERRGPELIWRILSRYFPEYVDKIAGAGYEEKEPSVRVVVKPIEVKGKKTQTATVTIGKRFVEDSSEDTLRARIREVGLALSTSGLKADLDQAPADAVWKIVHNKFPLKAHRVASTSYDANLPGLRTEFGSGSVTVGKATESWSAPIIYFGKAFLQLPPADQEIKVGEQLDKIDQWWVDTSRVVKPDLADGDVTSRIRGLTGARLTALRDAVTDPDVKAYVGSLLTTSTPMEEGLTPSPGGLTVTVGSVTVIVAPDTTGPVPRGFDASTPSNTSVTPNQIPAPHFDRHNVIDRFAGYSPTVTIRVRTTYRQGVSKDIKQGYGKGTTAREKELGATSLRYHEGSHGLDVVRFVKSTPYPVFTGAVGDTMAEFRQKARDYIQARQQFNTDLQNFTDVREECPGTSIDQYMQNRGAQWTPICP